MSVVHDKPASFYASPKEALQAPPEEFLYLACLHEGTGVDAPDFLAVVDAEQGRIVHELQMPNVGDELHHYGLNRCSSACHGPDRSHLIVPGFRSSRIHIVNVADDPRAPQIEKVIEPEEIVAKTGYTRPHTVHCMPGDNVVVSMLGDTVGNGAGGFADGDVGDGHPQAEPPVEGLLLGVRPARIRVVPIGDDGCGARRGAAPLEGVGGAAVGRRRRLGGGPRKAGSRTSRPVRPGPRVSSTMRACSPSSTSGVSSRAARSDSATAGAA